MIDVSIIVPIYNRENTLRYCLDSIINLRYKNFEIILIDDGSTDGSAVLCKNFCKFHPEAQYYYKKNGGVSSARNWGIEKAQGKWITFIDSDDAVRPEHLDIISWETDCDKDWLIESFCSIHDKDIRNSKNLAPLDKSREVSSTPAIDYFTQLPQTGIYLFSVCGKFFKREICRQKQILFREGINLGEDQIFILDYLRYIKSMVFYPGMHTYIQIDRFIVGKGQRLTSKVLPLKEYYNAIYQNYEAFRALDCLAQNMNVPYAVNNLVRGIITLSLINYCRQKHSCLLQKGELITYIRDSVAPLFTSVLPYKEYIKRQEYYIYAIYSLIVSKRYRIALAMCYTYSWYRSFKSHMYRFINR